mmetsp:Transcript_23897/g.21738  ORF Transcript_23897/g.21738 Transcript_23897/m.21738 type:complete len:153 (+) Transcript_23897:74-532(+)
MQAILLSNTYSKFPSKVDIYLSDYDSVESGTSSDSDDYQFTKKRKHDFVFKSSKINKIEDINPLVLKQTSSFIDNGVIKSNTETLSHHFDISDSVASCICDDLFSSLDEDELICNNESLTNSMNILSSFLCDNDSFLETVESMNNERDLINM